jgi:hypothetical protein
MGYDSSFLCHAEGLKEVCILFVSIATGHTALESKGTEAFSRHMALLLFGTGLVCLVCSLPADAVEFQALLS